MIVYELRCAADHPFEGWFRNSDAYETQASSGQISCPHCGSDDVRKAPMAPSISRGHVGKRAEHSEEARQLLVRVEEMCRTIEQNCAYVGDGFAEEARKIHYGETQQRAIYGEASAEEATELQDEGIAIASVPWVPRSDA